MGTLILFNVFNGLIIGLFYVLMALGLAMILNLSNVINFAHGNFLTLGGYFAFMLVPVIGFWGALVVAPLAVAAIGLILEPTIFRPVYGRDPVYSLLLTFGLAFIIQDLCRYVWSPDPLQFTLPQSINQPVSQEFFFLTGYRLFVIGIVVIAVAALFLFLRYSRMGMRIRAGVMDLETVAALGINVRRLRTLNFGMGIFLAGLAGVLAGGAFGLNPNMGDVLLLPAFVAIIVGGVGSMTGTLFGGLLIGVAAAVTTIWWPAGSELVIYLIMTVVLLIRPRGLMGEEGMMT
ncbi:MAG: branched-chain amino acid ABC transporter permease [Alphaproteobacteria bacterium]|nr:branched-chain amino acid ABC transporter permease [Alphaproteobacteria bacterium]